MSESSKPEIEWSIAPVVEILVKEKPAWAKKLTQQEYENTVQWFNHIMLESTEVDFDTTFLDMHTRVSKWTFTRDFSFPWDKH